MTASNANRGFGTDALLEHRSAMTREAEALTVSVRAKFVTKIETITKRLKTDTGLDEIVAKMFTEKDACLVTIRNWDVVPDKDAVMRTHIVPALTKFDLEPTTTIVLQFLDSKGEPMRHIPSPMPKATLV